MATFNASDIIGKTLYAKTSVPKKLSPSDSAPTNSIFAPGTAIGVVDSFILPLAGRNQNMYWAFRNGIAYYYVEHKPGLFDIKSLGTQQVKSLEQIAQDQANENMTIEQKIVKYGAIVGLSIGAFLLLRDYVKK